MEKKWGKLLDSAELIRLAQEGNAEAREQVIVDNIALVWSVVKRFTGRGYEAEDLFQIGSIGLMKAVDRFDTSYEVKLSTYAVPMIIGEIKRFIRDDGIVKISRGIKENGWHIKQAAGKLSQQMNREPTIEEIASETGLSKEDIVIAMEADREVESIYSEAFQGRENGCDDDKETVINRIFVDGLLDTLSNEERKLIELRYYQDKTQMQVAGELGISQVQVSRIEKKILIKLRKKAV